MNLSWNILQKKQETHSVTLKLLYFLSDILSCRDVIMDTIISYDKVVNTMIPAMFLSCC